MAIELRRGQAFVELACGMLALALVLAALFGFTAYIVASLDGQRGMRARAGRAALTSGFGYASASFSDTVTVEPMAAEYVFGATEVEVREEVHIPAMSGLE